MICVYKPELYPSVTEQTLCSILRLRAASFDPHFWRKLFQSFLKKAVQEVNLLWLKWFKNYSKELKGFLYLGHEKIGRLMCLGAMWGVLKNVTFCTHKECSCSHQEFHSPFSCITGSQSYSIAPLGTVCAGSRYQDPDYWGSRYQDQAWEWRRKANIWQMRSV